MLVMLGGPPHAVALLGFMGGQAARRRGTISAAKRSRRAMTGSAGPAPKPQTRWEQPAAAYPASASVMASASPCRPYPGRTVGPVGRAAGWSRPMVRRRVRAGAGRPAALASLTTAGAWAEEVAAT